MPEFDAYLSQGQTKESALSNIVLEQEKWNIERADCTQRMAAQDERVKSSRAHLSENASSRDFLGFFGAALGVPSAVAGLTFTIVTSSQYGILAFLYPPFWLALGGVGLVSALVVGSIFCGLHSLATKTPYKKNNNILKKLKGALVSSSKSS